MMSAELSIDGMTWGELREFVRLGRYLPNEAEVDQVGDFSNPEETAALSVLIIPEVD